jgi:hypothetical protein
VRTDAGYQLLDEVPSNDFMGQMIVFDDFTYSIPVGSSIEFLVTVDAKEELGSEFFPPLRISLV